MTQKGHFKVDVYNCVVHIRVCDNEKSFLQAVNYYIRKDGGDIITDWKEGYSYGPKDDTKNYYIFFNKADVSIEIFNHEKSHIVDFILEDRDIPTSDEAKAFLDGFIAHKLNLFFKSRKIKIKDKR